MNYVIIVDAKSQELNLLISQIEERVNISTIIFSSVSDAKKFVETQPYGTVKVLILNISHSLDNYTPISGIGTILITKGVPLQSKNILLSKGLIESVTDYSTPNKRYIISLLERNRVIQSVKVLICDREKLTRNLLIRNLASIGITSVEAKNGKQALEIIHNSPEICMVFIGRHIQIIDEFSLMREIRKKQNKFDLPIIGLVNEEDSEEVEIQFLRHGATDCLQKRFSTPLALEYLQSRVMLSFQQVLARLEITNLAQKDFLTGLNNRRHFFEIGQSVFENYKRGNITLTVAMLDIDNFKRVNDVYGHPAGDMAIVAISNELEKQLRKSDTVARFGGEEFCVLLTGSDPVDSLAVMERIRAAVEEIEIKSDDNSFSFTVSIGMTVQPNKTLDDMIKVSDDLLYRAKNAGKNRVISDL
jgi:diguanylate cyclase (GGDEF)-like protein